MGIGAPRPAGLSRRRRPSSSAPCSSIRSCRRRIRSTAASLLALGEQAAAERAFREELDLNINDFEANLQLGNMRKIGAASSPRRRRISSARRRSVRPISPRASCSPACACRPARWTRRPRCSRRSSRTRPTWSRRTCSSRPPTTASKRQGRRASGSSAIVDRLNAEAQAKQKGGRQRGACRCTRGGDRSRRGGGARRTVAGVRAAAPKHAARRRPTQAPAAQAGAGGRRQRRIRSARGGRDRGAAGASNGKTRSPSTRRR